MKKIICIFLLLVMSNGLFSQEGEKATFEVYFENNKSELTKKNTDALNLFFTDCKKNEYVVNSIETYCDTVGSMEFNQHLSDRRLRTINNAFIKNGIIVSNQISKGELNNPTIDNSSCRKAVIHYSIKINKPVEVEIIEKPKVEKKDKFSGLLTASNGSAKVAAIDLDIQFTGGTATILDISQVEVDNLYNFMNENKEFKAFIRGHVCCKVDPVLSEQRAEAVYDLLIYKGIDPSRLTHQGFSNTMPVAFPEITAEDQQRNRRVDVVFSK